MSIVVQDVLIRDLADAIQYHADLYYNHSEPEITDAEFDELIEEMRTLDPEHEVLANVGAPVANIPEEEKLKHGSLMGSLNKATWDDNGKMTELQEWIAKNPEYQGGKGCRLIVTPKMDGAACRNNYKDGKHFQAATRGNGEYGQDVTKNAKVIDGIPHNIPGFSGEVRGEVCMSFPVFESLIESGLDIANPRNAASGALTAKDVEKTREKQLQFVAYDVLDAVDNGTSVHFADEEAKLLFLKRKGFDVVPHQRIFDEEAEAVAYDWENVKREKCSMPIDGLVFTYFRAEDQEEVGWGSNRPKGRVAWKFRPEEKEAELLGVFWQVGRTGRLTPVAQISPTRLAGTIVQKVTLHNWAHFAELKLHTGDTVLVKKAGEIIPQIVKKVRGNGGNVIHGPQHCSCCDSLLELDEKSVNLWCNNPACQAKLEANIEHYLKRMEILGIGPATIHGMVEAGVVKDLADLYYIDMRELRGITGGSGSAQKMIEAVLQKNEVPLAQFLSALGIHGLGKTTSKDVAKKFKTLDGCRQASLVMLCSIEGIGEKTARAILDGLDKMGETIDKLIRVIDVLEVEEVTGPLVGKSFCLTGSMSRKRGEIAADIEAAGGTVKSSVGRGLDYLVQADATSVSSKSKKARTLGVEVIGEKQLEEMMA